MVEKIWNIVNDIRELETEGVFIREYENEFAVSFDHKVFGGFGLNDGNVGLEDNLFIIRENSEWEISFSSMPKYSIYLNWRTHDKETDIENLCKRLLIIHREFKLKTILND